MPESVSILPPWFNYPVVHLPGCAAQNESIFIAPYHSSPCRSQLKNWYTAQKIPLDADDFSVVPFLNHLSLLLRLSVIFALGR